MYGSTGIIIDASNNTARAPTGSTAPLSEPIKNTKAEPSIVPNSGISSPMINVVVITKCKCIKIIPK
jgi:hypothetical protein